MGLHTMVRGSQATTILLLGITCLSVLWTLRSQSVTLATSPQAKSSLPGHRESQDTDGDEAFGKELEDTEYDEGEDAMDLLKLAGQDARQIHELTAEVARLKAVSNLQQEVIRLHAERLAQDDVLDAVKRIVAPSANLQGDGSLVTAAPAVTTTKNPWPEKPSFVLEDSAYQMPPPFSLKPGLRDQNITVPLCNGPLEECIIIVTVIDHAFGLAKTYSAMMRSVKCYAARHGYGYRTLDPMKYHRQCYKMRDFFFKKHCAIRQAFIAGVIRKNAAILVLDGDMVAANVDVPLTKYLTDGADVVVYERQSMPEIAAGGYFLRNSPLGLAFVTHWLEYSHPVPKGFTSSDNGAIHLVLQRLIRPDDPDAVERAKEYYNLTATIGNIKPYLSWVQRVCQSWGDPAVHTVVPGKPQYIEGLEDHHTTSTATGKITIWPRIHGMAVDGSVVGWSTAGTLGTPFFHGVKDPRWMTKKRDDGCTLFRGRPVDEMTLMTQILTADNHGKGATNREYRPESTLLRCYGECTPLPDAAANASGKTTGGGEV